MWAILLWTVVVLVIALVQLAEGLCEGVAGAELAACRELERDPSLLLLAFGLSWVVGALVLLATRPGGAARHFVVTVLVNMIAIMATLALLGLVQLPSSGADGVPISVPLLSIGDTVLEVAILIALATAIIRPILLVVSGRWLLRSVGLMVLAVNAVLFWLVGEFAGASGYPWITPEPRLLWILLASVVFTALVTALGAVLGLDRPRLDREPRQGIAWRVIDRMPPQRRNALIENIRLLEVYDTISRFGQEIALGGRALGATRRLGDRIMGRPADGLASLSTPAKVRVMLQQLGPTYVKLGQMASSRADALPPDWRVELEHLQNTVPPFPWQQARGIIHDELGADPQTLFASINEKPLAAASLAQVHRAELRSGQQVVVKVQRPDVQAKVRADLGVIAQLAEVAEARSSAARRLGAVGLVQEFSDGVLEELDYGVEAYHARRLADILDGMEGVGVPRTYPEFSTDRVLTMDFVHGVKATKADALDAALDRTLIARRFIRATIKQVLIDGFFHADPHPGNVILNPSDGRLTFLDLGLVGELQQQQRIDLLALLWALRTRDPAAVARVTRRLCVATGPVDEPAFQAAAERLVYRYWVYGGSSFSGMMSALFATLDAHSLRMRRELTLAVKALTQSEELMRAIAPDLPLVSAAAEEAEGLLREHLTPDRLASMARGKVQELVEQAISRPEAFGGVLPALLGSGLLGTQVSVDDAEHADRPLGTGEAGRYRSSEAFQRLITVLGLGAISIALGLLVVATAVDRDLFQQDVEAITPYLLGAVAVTLAYVLWRWRAPA
jgi:ubiquinone biosynthesis protein